MTDNKYKKTNYTIFKKINVKPLFKDTPCIKTNNELIGRFINLIMKDGKKSLSEMIFINTLSVIKKKTEKEPILIFQKAVKNLKPALEVRGIRIAGKTCMVPLEIKPKRQETLALRWLIQIARKRPEKNIHHKLAYEIIDAANNQGLAFKKRNETHKLAELNRVFANYRW